MTGVLSHVMSGGDEQLSRRELEVLRLIVEGLSNARIAQALSISERTVQAHLTNAYRKTATATRTQIAVWALRSGTVPMTEKDDESAAELRENRN